jgi:hypothetical protein
MRTGGIRSWHVVQSLQLKLVDVAVCKLFWLLPHAQGLCTCQHSQLQAAVYARPKYGTSTQTSTAACCATRFAQLRLSAGCCVCCLLCAQGLCCTSTQPGRYSLQGPLTDLTHLNEYCRCMLVGCISYGCLLLSAGCCVLAACRVCATCQCSQAGTAWSL